jgi:predicted MFS family arabinose efflux permease
MLGALLTRLNDSVSWSFNARYAESAHVDAQTLGLFLGLLTLACAAAPYVGSALCRRYGHLPTFVGIAIVKALATAGLYLATELVAFALFQAVLFFTFVIVVQLLASALAVEDRSGRLPALGVLPLMLGDVLGPSIAGISYESDGLAGVTLAACAAAVAAALVLVAAIALRKTALPARPQVIGSD